MAVSSSSLTDSSFEAQELSSLLLNASSSSSDILNSCRAVESFIDRHTRDQTRHFYITCFPVLLRKIFGFEEVLQPSGIGGWIAQTSEHSSNAIVNLLSPSGALFSSIFAADEENVVCYVFPSERLPAWIRPMLQSERGLYILSEVCPALFKGRLKEDVHGGGFQVQLNAFEYFMFWFAYYPVCKDNDNMNRSDSDEMKLGFKKGSRSRFEKWASSLHSLHGSHGNRRSGKFNSSPYLHLLNLYLHKFVPISDFCAPSVSAHHFFEENPSMFSRAEFVVHTFVQFWLVNDDFSPLPLRLCQSFGIVIPVSNLYHRYALPSVEITEAVRILVNYVNSTLCCPQEELNSGWRVASQIDTPRLRSFSLPLSSLVVPATWSHLLQRPLYRFILRAFSYWPVGACLKKAAYIVDLWLDYLQPWNIGAEGEIMPALEEDHYFEAENKMLRDRDQRLSSLSGSLLLKQKTDTDSVGSVVKRSKKESCYGYNDQWQNYVLANYPFYSSLIVQFLVFAHKFVHIDTKAVLQMTHKVLSVLVSSKELLCLIRSVDSAYNDVKLGNAPCCFDSLYKVVPAIREQLQDWEGDLSNFEKGSEITHSPLQKGTPMLQLFSTCDSGGHQMLNLLILRAEAWIQTGSGEKILPGLNSLEALKVLTIRIFGSCEMGAPVELVSMYNSESEKTHFIKHPGLGRHTWADIKYRGDWMRRPIEDTEVAWLARLLVRISDWLNTRLGLDHQDSTVHINNSWDENSYNSMRTSEPIFAEIIEDEDEVSLVDFLSNRTDRKSVV